MWSKYYLVHFCVQGHQNFFFYLKKKHFITLRSSIDLVFDEWDILGRVSFNTMSWKWNYVPLIHVFVLCPLYGLSQIVLLDSLGAKFKDTSDLCKNGVHHYIIFNAGTFLFLFIVLGVILVFLIDLNVMQMTPPNSILKRNQLYEEPWWLSFDS